LKLDSANHFSSGLKKQGELATSLSLKLRKSLPKVSAKKLSIAGIYPSLSMNQSLFDSSSTAAYPTNLSVIDFVHFRKSQQDIAITRVALRS
jgi:hypothetical protein